METTSGGVTVNDVLMHYTVDTLPFGGVGKSDNKHHSRDFTHMYICMHKYIHILYCQNI